MSRSKMVQFQIFDPSGLLKPKVGPPGPDGAQECILSPSTDFGRPKQGQKFVVPPFFWVLSAYGFQGYLPEKIFSLKIFGYGAIYEKVWTVIPQSFQGQPKSWPTPNSLVYSSSQSQATQILCRQKRLFLGVSFLQNKFSRPNGRLSPVARHTYSESYCFSG